MKQFIAPRVLTINGKKSPCKCGDKIICEYCVQANLVLWEKEQHPEEETHRAILKTIEASGIRNTAKKLMIKHSTVSNWIKTGNIPLKYIEMLQKN